MSAAAAPKIRKTFFWIHLIVGLAAGLVVLNLAVTGMILAFETQIQDWAEKDRRFVAVPENGARLNLEEIVERAKAAMPGKKVSAVTVKSDPAASAMVGFGREGGSVYVNPYNGETLGGDSKVHHFMHWVEDWHRWFGKKEFGKPITGAATLVFMFLALSGLYLWWPKSWNLSALKSVTLFGKGLSGRARDWNWHNVFGIWSLLLILVTATTGAIMSYDWASNLLYRATGNEPPVFNRVPEPPQAPPQAASQVPATPPAKQVSTPTESEMASLSDLFAAAQKVEPVWVSISLRMPQKPGGPVNATVQIPHGWHPYPRTLVTLNARTAEVTKADLFSKQNMGVRLRVWVKPVHTGEAGGLIGQILMFLASGGAVMLVWTGVSLSLRRYASYRAKKKSVKLSIHQKEVVLN